MKTLEELNRLRERVRQDIRIRQQTDTRIIIGMGTCGIAAGARDVLKAALEEVAKRHLEGVSVQQTGCIGMCEQEVLLDVVLPGQPRIIYGKVTPDKVERIVVEHVVNGRIVEEWVVAKIEN
nr:(2Fe-2S) ferredoxin domain-containing protein [uncultured Anaeromusa sp.]